MKICKKRGFLPTIVPEWKKRMDTVAHYISELELCLETANQRIAEQKAEIALLRKNMGCVCGRVLRSCGCDEEAREV
jgi:uncharacterized coiled-coil protein SlyX